MTSNRNKLELTWINKDQRPKLEPRVLVRDDSLSFHAGVRSSTDRFDNRLIFGDNLLGLKALEQEFSGKVKCIYIDPPYNTGQAFEHYDDGLEHSIWLGLMRDRFELLRKLLKKDGLLFCQLNDDEMAYGKILLDEVFGRSNFLNLVSIKMKQTAGASGGGEDKRLKKNIEYLLIYAFDKEGAGGFEKFNDFFDEEDLFEVIDDMRENGKSWKYTRILRSLGERKFLKVITDGGGDPIKIFSHSNVVMEPISKVSESEGISEKECYVKYFDKIFRDTNAQSSIRTRVMDAVVGTGDFFSIEYVPRSGKSKGLLTTVLYKGQNCDQVAWLSDIAVRKSGRLVKLEKAGTYWDGFPLNNLTKEGGVLFPNGKKPEALIRKIFDLATDPEDLILDSFAGSGTTGAVAHKMGRRWIMIEMGEHCHTHIIPRMQKVIDGTDQGGISQAVGWKGGGGFRYYRLAPSLIKRDTWDNEVINPDYNPEMVAEAVCKLEGFTYAPSETEFWKQGHSTENDFIYVTTQALSAEQLERISDEVGPKSSLLICCGAFRVKDPDRFANLTLKKIPKTVLDKCEWDKDDYSLEINQLPLVEEEAEEETETPVSKREVKAKAAGQVGLFDEGPEKKKSKTKK